MSSLKHAVVPPNWGEAGNPRAASRIAACAEESGWDGFFTWDALLLGPEPKPSFDPLMILSAAAMSTQSIRLGTCILVVARHQPHLLAMRLASLDVVSEGRLIVGVGLGDGSRIFEAFGESGEPRVRAEKTDEALEIITRLWAGEFVVHHGKHYTVDGFAINPLPVQQPRVPIWIGGDSAGALRRAAAWDGWIGPDEDPLTATGEDLTKVHELLLSKRAGNSLDIAWAGAPNDDSSSGYETMRSAGATWHIVPLMGEEDEIIARVRRGPIP